jgi:DHA2 family multidrug resistance protein
VTATFGTSVGPTIVGWLTDNYDWQWIFYINIVPGLVMLAIIWLCLEEEPMDLSLLRSLDYFGIIMMHCYALMVSSFEGETINVGSSS